MNNEQLQNEISRLNLERQLEEAKVNLKTPRATASYYNGVYSKALEYGATGGMIIGAVATGCITGPVIIPILIGCGAGGIFGGFIGTGFARISKYINGDERGENFATLHVNDNNDAEMINEAKSAGETDGTAYGIAAALIGGGVAASIATKPELIQKGVNAIERVIDKTVKCASKNPATVLANGTSGSAGGLLMYALLNHDDHKVDHAGQVAEAEVM